MSQNPPPVHPPHIHATYDMNAAYPGAVQVGQRQYETLLTQYGEGLKDRDNDIRSLRQQLEKMEKTHMEALKNREQQISNLKQERRNLEQNHAETLRAIEDHVAKIESQRMKYEDDINSLRGYIANMKIPQAQVNTDAYYIDKLQGLNRLIQASVADVFVDSKRQKSLSKEEGEGILAVLSQFADGNFTATLLNNPNFDNIWTLHQDARKRVAFVRHVITLFLVDRVFAPFVFGLSPGMSNLLQNIEDAIMVNGKLPIANLLIDT
jgi:hypothetical protein